MPALSSSLAALPFLLLVRGICKAAMPLGTVCGRWSMRRRPVNKVRLRSGQVVEEEAWDLVLPVGVGCEDVESSPDAWFCCVALDIGSGTRAHNELQIVGSDDAETAEARSSR